MEPKLKFKEIDYGIACRIEDTIYYNKNLKKYPELLKAILEHEKEHTLGFELQDIILDLNGTHLKEVKKEYYKFILLHPSSLTMLLPVLIYDKRTVIDPIILFLWIFVIIMLTTTFLIIR